MGVCWTGEQKWKLTIKGRRKLHKRALVQGDALLAKKEIVALLNSSCFYRIFVSFSFFYTKIKGH